MDGQRLGIWSLRIDALYCLVLGALAVAFAPPLAGLLEIPQPAIVVIGAAVMAWAGIVAWMSRALGLRAALRTVMVANLVVAVGVAAWSAAAAALFTGLGLVTVAVDVGLFAGSQGWALRRLRATR